MHPPERRPRYRLTAFDAYVDAVVPALSGHWDSKPADSKPADSKPGDSKPGV